jgi:hypothetical protein
MSSALAAVAVLCLSVAGGCGGSDGGANRLPRRTANAASLDDSTDASATTTKTTSVGLPTHDVDGDGDNNEDDYRYGRAAGTAEMQAVTELVKRYYVAAASDEGARACTMIYSIFAEEIPEVYGEGPPALRGDSCAVVMNKWFKMHHRELTTDLTEFAVTAVRVKALHALALLGFKRTPPHDIRVHLEHGVWKIDEPLDSAVG